MSSKANKDGFLGEITPDLLERQSDFFEEYFKKGAEFTRALIAENEDLKRRLSAAEAQVRAVAEGSLMTEQSQIEAEQFDLACLFVAQGQLARARDTSEAIGVVAEILLNFIGADRSAIYAADATGTLRPLFAAEIDLADLPLAAPARLVRAFQNSAVIVDEVIDGPVDVTADPLVAIPLRAAGETFGAIAVWGFLGQKTRVARIDHRLFELIADVGGGALESTRVRGQAPRLAGRVDHYSGLSLLLNVGSRRG